MARAAQRAYDSVREPAEGTMLTVMRDMAAPVATELAHMPDARAWTREADAERAERAASPTSSSARSPPARRRSSAAPSCCRSLREAGVVDAGGYGVTIIFAGIVAALRGSEAPELEHHAARAGHPPRAPQLDLPLLHELRRHRRRPGRAARSSARSRRLGDSVLVVGDAHTLKVHVHTDEPERAIAVFDGAGEVSRLDVADMHEQVAERDERLASAAGHGRRCAAARWPSRAATGMPELFEGLGAHVLDGGPTLNPSTHELLAGIHEVPAEEVVVLPNSPNVVMAAERAAELSEKVVRVVPTRSQQAGLAAAVALNAELRGGRRTRPRCAPRSSTSAPAASRPRRARTPPGASPSATPSATSRRSSSPGASPRATLRDRPRRAWPTTPSCVTCHRRRRRAASATRGCARSRPTASSSRSRDGGQPSWWWLLAAE